jgi:hypothetical protein
LLLSSSSSSEVTRIRKIGEFEDKRFEAGFKFILSHFEYQIHVWPRTISTQLTNRVQIPVYDERYALAKFKQSNLIDCRINGYPTYVEYKRYVRQTPDFIFIDLDLDNFLSFANWSSKQLLDMALENTLWKISKIFGKEVQPTVLWTGNGYHIYLPIRPIPIPLESDIMFSKFQSPSKEFLKFVSRYLTDAKSDPNNKPTFGSCLVRIPGSFNSKCLEAGKGLEESQVKLVQRWNGIHPKMPIEILTDFKGYLTSLKIRQLEEEEQKQQQKKHQYYGNNYYCINNTIGTTTTTTTTIPWIERLLQTPINDYRKFAIRIIIAPYLITTRGLDYNQSFEIIKDWLHNKCDRVERLNPRDFNHVIKEALNRSVNQSWRPISLDKLKKENLELYAMIMK